MSIRGMNEIQSLTLLTAVDFIVLSHELFKPAQQLHGLLMQTHTQNQRQKASISNLNRLEQFKQTSRQADKTTGL